MLTLLFRKMRNTKWMVICLLVGFIMASAMMSTVPIYMNASLQRMLTKDMEAYQLANDIYPGIYSVEQKFTIGTSVTRQRDNITRTSQKIADRFAELNSPLGSSKEAAFDTYLYVTSMDISATSATVRLNLGYMTNIDDHITVTDGRMYSPGLVDGVYEVICTEGALKTTGLAVGQEYEIGNVFGETGTIKIRIVGVFKNSDDTDTYWSEGMDAYFSHFIMDRETFFGEVLDTGAVNVSKIQYRYIIDYPNMSMQNIDGIYDTITEQLKLYKSDGLTLEIPALDIFKSYTERASQLRLILWLLQIPVMLMLVFYLFMVSQLNVEQEKNEISVFKSRGASSKQILCMYGLESVILGVISALAGPFVGLLLCRILGVSNGFLEFVNRPSLPVRLTLDAFIYSLAAVLVFFITTMVPIIPATKTSIVEHKRKNRKKKSPLWQKIGLDFIMILGSAGWLVYYNYQQNSLIEQGLSEAQSTVNPMMFVAPTAFMLGCGMLFIRIYPSVLRLIYRIGRKAWSPAAYISLNNVSRSSSGREKFLIIFLILTVSLGLYSANTARALNRASEDRISYDIGADAVIAEDWKTSGGVKYSQLKDEDTSENSYTEPVFERYEALSGVETATKVFRRSSVHISSMINGLDLKHVELMSVIPDEFAQVAWSDNSILPVHINNYLNALATCQDGIILSSSFKQSGVELGDVVSVRWSSNAEFSATVIAFVDYWPSINPYEKNSEGEYINFAVMNFNYTQVMAAVEPYQVWLDLEENASIADFYADIEENEMEPMILRVASQEIVSDKNDPMLQGMNGALTLGFIIIMVMCIIGFLIYWILSIKSRTLQFGILRAMGMSFREIIAMLLYEQLMTSGAAIFMAIIIGSLSSDLFVPLFQSMYSAIERVPPFKVIPFRADYLKVYAIVGIMLVAGFAILGRLISKIKINQALKLGED